MPCRSDGYSESRAMDPSEAWKSFSRHHTVLELETEALRKACARLAGQIDRIKEMFPGVKLPAVHIPKETPAWRGQTYRDEKGKFPNDIREHLDWLSEKDFK